MSGLGLEGCDILYDISRLLRKRAHLCNNGSEFENSDVIRFKKQLRKTKNVEEDYVQYLMLLYDYEKYCQSYTNKGRNEGSMIILERPNHDEDDDEDDRDDEEENKNESQDEDEDKDKDEDDQEYLKFLANAKPDGKSYVLKIDRKDGFPTFLKYEKEDGSDDEYEHLGQEKQQDAGGEKDLCNDSCDEVESQQNGALKRRQKGETKGRSKKEQKTEKGRKGRKSASKGEVVDVDEDYSFHLEKFMYKNWHLKAKAPFVRRYKGYKVKQQPSDPLSPKTKKKRGRPSKQHCMKENDASKGEKKRTSSKERTIRKGRKSANVTVAEEVAGRELATVAVKEEVPKEASFGHDFECQAPEEVLQILDKEGSSVLMEASSAKHYESLEDSCYPAHAVRSDFWWNVKALLERPYDQKEYVGLMKAVKKRKHITRNMDLRNGVKFYSTKLLGKSYLDHYKDLHEKLKEVEDDKRKKLNILRGFFFWLQNLTQEGAFKPWTDLEWLSLVAKI